MPTRSLFIVAALALAVACHRPADSAPEAEQPATNSPEPVQQLVLSGRVLRDGAPLAGVHAKYGVGEADADVSDADGQFELTLTDDFARAPAIYLSLTTGDGRRFGGVLRNPGKPFSLSVHEGDPARIELHDASPEEQAWVDVHAWGMREFNAWMSRPKDDYAAHRAHWTRVAEAIAAEPDDYRRGLMTAAQFMIGRSEPEHGLDRSAVARAALDELGLDDPRWSIDFAALALAVHESGRWTELAPRLDELITEHPQPEVAALITLERYTQTSKEHAAEAAAIWQRWLDRPSLARTRMGPLIATIGPKRALAPGQRLPELCVEDLAGGPLCLAELRGRVVVLEIWAIGCEGCQKATATLQAAYEATRGDAEAPLFVSISEWDEPEPLAAYLREQPMPWRHGWIRESERDAFRATLGVLSVPTFVLIDADGIIVASSPELQAEQLIERIAALRRAD